MPAVLSRFKQQQSLGCFEDWPSTGRRGEAGLAPIWSSLKPCNKNSAMTSEGAKMPEHKPAFKKERGKNKEFVFKQELKFIL